MISQKKVLKIDSSEELYFGSAVPSVWIRPLLWISKCEPAFPSLWVASFLPITQTKLTQSILHLQLAFDDPEQSKAPLISPFSVDSPRALDLKLEALRSKTSKTFFPLETKRYQQFKFLLRVFIKKFNVWRERVQIRKNFFQ